MSAQTQLYMLVPVSPDEATASNLPKGAVFVQLANAVQLTHGPVTVTPLIQVN